MENKSQNKARVIAEYKGAYKVKNENEEFLARVTGKQIFTAQSREDFPAVGDWVVIDPSTPFDKTQGGSSGQVIIKEILPRKTIIKRTSSSKKGAQIIATNIDVAFVVESIGRDFNLNRFERYFAITKDSFIKPAIIINKIDLISKDELDEKLKQIKNRFPEIDVITTSTVKNEGLDELKNYIQKSKIYCFLGSSGVGKSSLINKLLGKDLIKTEDISLYSNRGKHITTARQMYFLPNGEIVIDNPGMREVGMTDVSEGIDNFFDQISGLAENCKYKDCTHAHEKGCAVLKAVESGELDNEKYLNYINLKKESEFYQMSEIEKREKDKSFGKFIKQAKKDLKSHNHKTY